MNEDMAHDPPVGCVFDWWDDERMFGVGVVSGRLCHDCQGRLQQLGVPSAAFLAVQKILEYGRRALIGQETAVATKVFIAHGQSDDWLQLKAILEDLGLEIAEFNEKPAAGVLVPERWKEMLDQSRFAFALLTPDDKDVHRNSIPRFNVVHEIGLCHARLGLESTAILREESVSLFSNQETASSPYNSTLQYAFFGNDEHRQIVRDGQCALVMIVFRGNGHSTSIL